MIGPRYLVLLFCGLLIAGVGTAEARGGGGHAASHDTSHNSGPNRQIPQAYHKSPHAYVQRSRVYVQGPWAPWRFPLHGSQANRPILNAGKVSQPCGPGGCKTQLEIPTAPGNPYPSAPNPAGWQRAMGPMAASYASAPQFQYSCTINAHQPEAGGACVVNSSTRRYSGDRCSCHRQWGTID